MQCSHPVEKVRFLPCKCADRFPGMWVCDGCGDKFSFDPQGRTSIRYLDHPNPTLTRGKITFAEGGNH